MGFNFDLPISQIKDGLKDYLDNKDTRKEIRSSKISMGSFDLVTYSLWKVVDSIDNESRKQNIASFLGHKEEKDGDSDSNNGNETNLYTGIGRRVVKNLQTDYKEWFGEDALNSGKTLTLKELERNLLNMEYRFEDSLESEGQDQKAKKYSLTPDQEEEIKAIFNMLRSNGKDTKSNTHTKPFETSISKKIEEMVQHGHYQIIFTGAPGTGKTYSVRKFVEEGGYEYKFVQFHPSYDYTDFVEGLRPIKMEGSEVPTFVRLDGIFKEFCRTIVENNLNSIKKDLKAKNFHFDGGNGQDEKLLELIYRCAKNEGRFEEITNLDFQDKKDKELLKELCQMHKEGRLTRLDQTYYFIIDEINRADLSQVFGELMFGLEDSYRGVENRFDTQYKNLDTYTINEEGLGEKMEFDCFKKGFYIPHNLCIVGTMNDIDRSVESFDFALRRRFKWLDIKAKDVMEEALLSMLEDKLEEEKIKELTMNIDRMNKVISDNNELGLNEAYNIGPAYFKSYNGENLQEIWDNNIEPILIEYCRGRNSDIVKDFIGKCRMGLFNIKEEKMEQ